LRDFYNIINFPAKFYSKTGLNMLKVLVNMNYLDYGLCEQKYLWKIPIF